MSDARQVRPRRRTNFTSRRMATREDRFIARLDGYVDKIIRATEQHYCLEPGSLRVSKLASALDRWLESVEDEMLVEYNRDVSASEAPFLEQQLRDLLTGEPQPQSWFVAETGSTDGAVAMRLQGLIDQGEAEWVTGQGYRTVVLTHRGNREAE